ncbi:MAG: hypothetical protein L6R38_009004, partial [Xanthoria sp. 2 TBL-2021]
MDNLDGSDHYSKPSEGQFPFFLPPQTTTANTHIYTEPPISLLTIILDTHPSAWALLSPTLPFSTFLAHLLVFINAHLACNNSNQICLIAAHPQRAEFLYPSPSPPPSASPLNQKNGHSTGPEKQQSETISEANHYRPFLSLQQTLLTSLTTLLTYHSPSTQNQPTPSIALSGALTLALTYHNRLLSSLSTSKN